MPGIEATSRETLTSRKTTSSKQTNIQEILAIIGSKAGQELMEDQGKIFIISQS
jgi:hypothetical protein